MSAPRIARVALAEEFAGPGGSMDSVAGGAPRGPVVSRPRRGESVEEMMVRLGLIAPGDCDAVRRYAQKKRETFGRSAMRLGLISASDLEYALGVHAGFLREGVQNRIIPPTLIAARNPFSRHSIGFQALRAAISAQDGAQLFAVIGADVPAHAPFVAANLAISFAQLGQRVLLIDADPRRSPMTRFFAEADGIGVNGVVEDGVPLCSAVSPTLVIGLDLLASGAAAGDPQRMLATPKFAALLKEAKAAYDVCIVFSAPLGRGGEADFVLRAVGRVLAVARKDASRLAEIERLSARLRRLRVECLGAAMTC